MSTILIVDDHQTARMIMEGVLRPDGYDLLFASSGPEALQVASQQRPDLILLDVMMPGMDGYEVCRRLRQMPQIQEVPILLVTALEDSESRVQGFQSGADDFLSKPVDRVELRARVQTITRLNRYRRLLVERSKVDRLVELAPDGIVVADGEGTILLCNPTLLHMLAQDAGANLLGHDIVGFLVPAQQAACRAAMQQCLHDRERTIHLETTCQRQDMQSVPVEISMGSIDWDDIPAVEMFIRDVTASKQAEEQIKRSAARAEALVRVAARLNALLDMESVLAEVCQEAASVLGVSAALVSLYDPAQEQLELAAAAGLSDMQRELIAPMLQIFYHALVVHAEEYIAMTNVQQTNLLQHPPEGPFPMRSLLSVSMRRSGDLIGVLSILTLDERRDFSEDDLSLLQGLAYQAAQAIANARLFAERTRMYAELMDAYEATLRGWAMAVDLHDEETEGHSRRVVELTIQLARTVGVPDADLVHMRRGARLHDIGKIGVPDSILNKPGRLDPDEWAIVRKHPLNAYEMLKDIGFLQPAIAIPLYHHEKWDGSGYPYGLAGEDIPLSARIFALVDVWDALTSNRPYRAAWTKERTCQHIRAQAGKHFDPVLTEQFLALVCPASPDAE